MNRENEAEGVYREALGNYRRLAGKSLIADGVFEAYGAFIAYGAMSAYELAELYVKRNQEACIGNR